MSMVKTPTGYLPAAWGRDYPPSRAERIENLTEAARLHEGKRIDVGWLAAQLLDLRDLLRAREKAS